MLMMDYERAAFEQMVRALPTSNLPIRRPSFNDPTFWSRPIVKTKIEPLLAGTWVNFLEVQGAANYGVVIDKYVADSFGDNVLSNLEFRLIFGGTIPSNFSIVPGWEHHKPTPSSYPMVPQNTYFILETNDKLILQVRNTGVAQQLVTAAFFGYAFNTYTTEKGFRQGLTDNRSA